MNNVTTRLFKKEINKLIEIRNQALDDGKDDVAKKINQKIVQLEEDHEKIHRYDGLLH